MADLLLKREENKTDRSSFSNPSIALSTNIHLDWTVDFEKKLIGGTCLHSITVIKDGAETVNFDSSKLNIIGVSINNESATYEISPVDLQLGSKISVSIPKPLQIGGTVFTVLFRYSTSTEASAIQFLEPAATKGKKYPYVFTQSQAIHARSMLPCMDSPGVKTTYTATVTAPEWCTVLMSALSDNTGVEPKGVYKWRQPVPTSAYLIALAAGHLDFRDISRRVRVWAEPEIVEDAASDFSQTEEFLQAAESLTCAYVWTRYDVLCMPPSFPYGGMENPCLTFVTPTLLSGDKSLADVIAHEIAHSWTGNLVTNSTWEHFWLNEGWTVWLERKIMAKVKGEEFLKLSAQVGWKHLRDDLSLMGPDSGFTSLVWPLGGEDPDDAFSSVPYEKGFNLLYRLEHLMGSKAFGTFAKAYIQNFKFATATSGDFKAFFIDFFTNVWDPYPAAPVPTAPPVEVYPSDTDPLKTPDNEVAEDDSTSTHVVSSADNSPAKVVQYITQLLGGSVDHDNERIRLKEEARVKLESIDWPSLLHSKGMPADPQPSFDNMLAEAAEALADRWIGLEGKATPHTHVDGVQDDLQGWSTLQINLFLEFLLTYSEEAPFSESLLLALDKSYSFGSSGNSEIIFRWQCLCIRSDVAWIVPQIVAFITRQGRMKYVRPLYRALHQSETTYQSKSGKQIALDTFKEFKDMYHPIARKMVENDLTKNNDESSVKDGKASKSSGISSSYATQLMVYSTLSMIVITILNKSLRER